MSYSFRRADLTVVRIRVVLRQVRQPSPYNPMSKRDDREEIDDEAQREHRDYPISHLYSKWPAAHRRNERANYGDDRHAEHCHAVCEIGIGRWVQPELQPHENDYSQAHREHNQQHNRRPVMLLLVFHQDRLPF